jgi:hypothetical protein
MVRQSLVISHWLRMSDNPDKLSRNTIMAALHRLDELLREKGVIGELCIFGGAAMVLAFDARESTRDVDAIFVPKDDVLKCSIQVADEFDLRWDWINDGVKGFVSNRGEVTTDGMPKFDNLRIMRPTTEYLLAMKCLASRVEDYSHQGDKADVITLIRYLGITDAPTVCDLVCKYYKETLLPPKIRYFIEEIIGEMAHNS